MAAEPENCEVEDSACFAARVSSSINRRLPSLPNPPSLITHAEMLYTPARFLLIPIALAIRAPDGPSQQCADDAGPPWSDDNDEFGKNGRYHDNTPGIPILNADGSCPDPLKGVRDQTGEGGLPRRPGRLRRPGLVLPHHRGGEVVEEPGV